MDDNEVKDIMFKEVDLIQGVINRMASNSFMIKGWSLTVAGIAYSLNLSFGKVWILGVGITLLCFLFCFLDAFFKFFFWKSKLKYFSTLDLICRKQLHRSVILLHLAQAVLNRSNPKTFINYPKESSTL